MSTYVNIKSKYSLFKRNFDHKGIKQSSKHVHNSYTKLCGVIFKGKVATIMKKLCQSNFRHVYSINNLNIERLSQKALLRKI